MRIGQSRRASTIETFIGTTIAYFLGVGINIWVLPWFGFYPTLHDSFLIAAIFTVASVFRGYFVRRFFNWLYSIGVLV